MTETDERQRTREGYTAGMLVARLAYVLAATGLACVLGGACRRNACKSGDVACECPEGASCSQECNGVVGCSVRCAIHNGECSISGGDACTADCEDADGCKATCGRGSRITCTRAAKSCEVAVGDGSFVHCEGARLCDVRCAGGCDVDCPAGHCIVACGAPGRCHVSCAGPAATCPDGATVTCGVACQ